MLDLEMLRSFGDKVGSKQRDEGKTKNGHSVLLRLCYRDFAVLKGACREQGRDFHSIGRSLETQILIAASDAAIDACFRRMEHLRPAERSDADIVAQLKATSPALEGYQSRADFEHEFLIGTPNQIVRRLTEYADLGVTHFTLWFMDFPSMDGVRLFARDVMPYFEPDSPPRRDDARS